MYKTQEKRNCNWLPLCLPLIRPSYATHKAAIKMLFSRPKYLGAVTSPKKKKKQREIPKHKDYKRNMFSIEALKTGFINAKFKWCFSLLYKYNDKWDTEIPESDVHSILQLITMCLPLVTARSWHVSTVAQRVTLSCFCCSTSPLECNSHQFFTPTTSLLWQIPSRLLYKYNNAFSALYCIMYYIYIHIYMCVGGGWTATAQSVQRLAKGWTVPRSNPGGGEIFRTRPNRPWDPPSLVYNVYRVFPRGRVPGAWCWPPTPTSAPRSWKRRAIPLLTLWAFVACYRESRYILYIYTPHVDNNNCPSKTEHVH